MSYTTTERNTTTTVTPGTLINVSDVTVPVAILNNLPNRVTTTETNITGNTTSLVNQAMHFWSWSNSAQTFPLSPAVGAIVNINNIGANNGGFSLSGGRTTIPATGVYQLTYRVGAVNTGAVAGWCQTIVYRNAGILLGTNIISWHPNINSYNSATGSVVFSLNAGDLIDVRTAASVATMNNWISSMLLARLS